MNLNQQSFEAGMAGGDSLSFKAGQIAASVKRMGLLVPVAVTPAAEGGWRLVDGKARFLACAALGMKQVPCEIVRVREDLSDVFLS